MGGLPKGDTVGKELAKGAGAGTEGVEAKGKVPDDAREEGAAGSAPPNTNIPDDDDDDEEEGKIDDGAAAPDEPDVDSFPNMNIFMDDAEGVAEAALAVLKPNPGAVAEGVANPKPPVVPAVRSGLISNNPLVNV